MEQPTAPIPPSPSQFPSPPPAHALYNITVCMTCDYPLVGLALATNCPECGTPVAHSLLGHELAFTNRKYLRALGNGLRLIVWGLMLLYFAVINTHITLLFFLTRCPLWDRFTAGYAFAGTLAALYGLWIATRPEPGAPRSGPQHTTQRITRLAVLIPISGALFRVATTLMGTILAAMPLIIQDWFYFILPTLYYGVDTIINLSMGVAIFCFLRYTRLLAKRIPDANLIRYCTLYQWLLPLMALTVFWMPTFLSDDSLPYIIMRFLPISSVALACSFPRLLQKHIRSILATGQPARLLFIKEAVEPFNRSVNP